MYSWCTSSIYNFCKILANKLDWKTPHNFPLILLPAYCHSDHNKHALGFRINRLDWSSSFIVPSQVKNMYFKDFKNNCSKDVTLAVFSIHLYVVCIARSLEWMQPRLWAAYSKLARPANIIIVTYVMLSVNENHTITNTTFKPRWPICRIVTKFWFL